MTQQRRQIIRRFLLTALFAIGLALGCAAFARWHAASLPAKNPQIHISVKSADITKDDYIHINGEFINRTLSTHSSPWGYCAGGIKYFTDGKKIPDEVFKGKRIGYLGDCNIIEPGKTDKTTLYFDPIRLPDGHHDFYITSGGLRSNIITLNVSKAKLVGNCYGFTAYRSPSCDLISIVSDTHGVQAGASCKSYVGYIRDNTPLKPITSESHTDCRKPEFGEPTAYIVANIPKDDPDGWIDKLTNHFPNNPDEGRHVYFYEN